MPSFASHIDGQVSRVFLSSSTIALGDYLMPCFFRTINNRSSRSLFKGLWFGAISFVIVSLAVPNSDVDVLDVVVAQDVESPDLIKKAGSGRRVDLSKDLTLQEALQAISDESGVLFDQPLQPDTPIKPTGRLHNFWPALDYVLEQASLDIDAYKSRRNKWCLRPVLPGRASRTRASNYQGNYRIEVSGLSSRRDLLNPELSGMSIEIDLSWTPEISLLSVSIPLNHVRVTCDNEIELLSKKTGRIDVTTVREFPWARFELPVGLPEADARTIRKLSGKVYALVADNVEDFEIPIDSTVPPQVAGGITIRNEGLLPKGLVHEVRLGIDVKFPASAMESHREFLVGNSVHAVHTDGRRAEKRNFELYRQGPEGIGIAYEFDLGPMSEGWKIIYRSPTMVREEVIDYQIENLPLP